MQIIVLAVILGLLSAFIVLFLSRFELVKGLSIRLWFIMNAPKVISELFSCDFCLSWWICFILGLVLSFFNGPECILAAVLATPIARHML